MSRLTISGVVLYSDLTPAGGAAVRIIERDSAPGGKDDRILTETTDPDGRFEGLSTDWQDREGVVFGIDIPDVFRLDFVVTVDGHTHTGPFLLAGGRSAPIILPFGPPKPVAKNERDLVQVILLADDLVGAERTLYEFIETSAQTLTNTILGGSYRKITFLKGADATLAGMVSALDQAAARSTVEAVDLIFTTHGNTDAVVFADGRYPVSKVKAALLALPAERRGKFRVVFSTACFGVTHLNGWIGGGFNEASGSVGIYADSAVSYAPFLAAWAAEKTFAESVAAANAADIGNVADNAARAFYLARSRPVQAAQVDSDRKRAGGGRTRLYTTP